MIIFKNLTAEDFTITDSGLTIGALSQRDITDYRTRLSTSSDLILALTQTDKYVINDGVNDLSVSDAVDLVKGYIQKFPLDPDGKPIVRAQSIPSSATTFFTMCGDSIDPPVIGTGTVLEWDAANSGEWSTEGVQEGYKRKIINIQFIESVWAKDGTLFFFDAVKGSYLDFYLVHPIAGTLSHYVNHYKFQGDCPMGDELNTETCSNEIPSGIIFRIQITIPTADVTSNGFVELELYRNNTV